MVPLVKFYLKCVFAIAWPMALVVAVMTFGDTYQKGWELTADMGGRILLVLIVPAIFSVLLTIAQVLSMRKYGFALTAENLKVRQTRVVILSCGEEEAVHRCVTAIHRLPRATFTAGTDYQAGIIRFQTGRSSKGRGEVLEIWLRKRSDTRTMITVSSRPKGIDFLHFFDFAQNLRNVERIIAVLQQPTEDL